MWLAFVGGGYYSATTDDVVREDFLEEVTFEMKLK